MRRTHLAQVVTHILNEYGKDGNQVSDCGVGNSFDPGRAGPARVEHVGDGAGSAAESGQLA